MSTAQKKATFYNDRTARACRFEGGGKVMVLRPSQRHKLEVQWEGPADVIEKLSDTNYIVSVPEKRKLQQVHHSSLLKPYRQREVVVQVFINALEEISANIPEFRSVTDGGNTAKVVSD